MPRGCRPTLLARGVGRLEDDVLRKPGALLLAAPVVLGGFVATVARRGPVVRASGVARHRGNRGHPRRGRASPRRPASRCPSRSPPPCPPTLFVSIGTAHDPVVPVPGRIRPADGPRVREPRAPPRALRPVHDHLGRRGAGRHARAHHRVEPGHALSRAGRPGGTQRRGRCARGTRAQRGPHRRRGHRRPRAHDGDADGGPPEHLVPHPSGPAGDGRGGAGRDPHVPAARGRPRRGARRRASSGSSRSARWHPTPTTACGSRGSWTPPGSRSSRWTRSRSTRSPRRP